MPSFAQLFVAETMGGRADEKAFGGNVVSNGVTRLERRSFVLRKRAERAASEAGHASTARWTSGPAAASPARHHDARVTTAPQSLHLRDRGRPFVEVRLVLRAYIAPAAGRCLRLAAEIDRLGQRVDQFGAHVLVLLLLRRREEPATVAV